MTPDELAKSGSEHGVQRALFAWAKMAQHVGFDLAWDDRTYGPNAVMQFMPGGCNEHVAYPVPELEWLHAIPNGGLRDKKTAGQMKAEGVKRGISDIFLPMPIRVAGVPLGTVMPTLYCGLYIEMKRAATTKAGTRKALIVDRAAGATSEDQNAFVTYARGVGYAVSICFDWRSAAKDIQRYIETAKRNG